MVAILAGQRDAQLVEIQHPERKVEVLQGDALDHIAEGGAIFVVHVEDDDVSPFCAAPAGVCRMLVSAQDLPEPVLPTTMKCLRSSSSVISRAGTSGSW